MRDPKRIGRVITLVRELWACHPDLRLGQLMEMVLSRVNENRFNPTFAYREPLQLFYVEDDLWEAHLRGAILDVRSRGIPD